MRNVKLFVDEKVEDEFDESMYKTYYADGKKLSIPKKFDNSHIIIIFNGNCQGYYNAVTAIKNTYRNDKKVFYKFILSETYFLFEAAIAACIARFFRENEMGNVSIKIQEENWDRILLPFDYIFVENSAHNFAITTQSCECEQCESVRKSIIEGSIALHNDKLENFVEDKNYILDKLIFQHEDNGVTKTQIRMHNENILKYLFNYLMEISKQDMMRYYLPTKFKELYIPYDYDIICKSLMKIGFITQSKTYIKEDFEKILFEDGDEELHDDMKFLFKDEIDEKKRKEEYRSKPLTDAW